MPYLRLSSLRLDDATKRHVADELTATVLDILPYVKPEWTTVHFTPFEPDDFAIAGRLVSDGAVPDTHLDISAPGVDEKSWFALRNRLTDVLTEALGIPESDRWHVNVKLNAYDPHTYAVAGNPSDEIDADGHLEAHHHHDHDHRYEHDHESKAGGPGWLKPAAFAGFAIGAYFGYRWLAERIGSDATVDAAPPYDDAHGEAVDAGEPDPRTTLEPAAPDREPSTPATEY